MLRRAAENNEPAPVAADVERGLAQTTTFQGVATRQTVMTSLPRACPASRCLMASGTASSG